jgi:TetR/AcrR family transcriptional repressor of nem operon
MTINCYFLGMGRASRATAELHHEQLVQAAARLFRERDIGAVSVPDVMGEIGLTRGGFYNHFESKDALVAAAVEEVFRQHTERIEGFAAEHDHDPTATWHAFLDFALSAAHRDDPGTGCPGTLATGISRCDPDSPVRTAFVDGVRDVVQKLTAETKDAPGNAAAQRERLLADLAMLTGAILLSRATVGDPLSTEFLTAADERLRRP